MLLPICELAKISLSMRDSKRMSMSIPLVAPASCVETVGPYIANLADANDGKASADAITEVDATAVSVTMAIKIVCGSTKALFVDLASAVWA
jgi:hypothetical protein